MCHPGFPSRTPKEDLRVFALPLQSPVTCKCVWQTNAQKAYIMPVQCECKAMSVFFSIWQETVEEDCDTRKWKCEVPDWLCWLYSSFVNTPVANKKLMSLSNFHCFNKWSLFKMIKRQTNPIKHLLYGCANDCWNKLKAKSWVQCRGTRLVTNNTNYNILILSK